MCLSDVGTVLKVIALNVNSLETEEITLEELQVFKVSVKKQHNLINFLSII